MLLWVYEHLERPWVDYVFESNFVFDDNDTALNSNKETSFPNIMAIVTLAIYYFDLK